MIVFSLSLSKDRLCYFYHFVLCWNCIIGSFKRLWRFNFDNQYSAIRCICNWVTGFHSDQSDNLLEFNFFRRHLAAFFSFWFFWKSIGKNDSISVISSVIRIGRSILRAMYLHRPCCPRFFTKICNAMNETLQMHMNDDLAYVYRCTCYRKGKMRKNVKQQRWKRKQYWTLNVNCDLCVRVFCCCCCCCSVPCHLRRIRWQPTVYTTKKKLSFFRS